MSSMAAAEAALEGVEGLVFFAFPLHPSGKPGVERAEHLNGVTVPMLFLSGTRDGLGEVNLLRPVCERLGDGATLHLLHAADRRAVQGEEAHDLAGRVQDHRQGQDQAQAPADEQVVKGWIHEGSSGDDRQRRHARTLSPNAPSATR